MEVHQLKNPLSPVNGGTSIPHFQLMQTPVKAEVDCRTSGKGSHIRKSLRTIGKLINGSEKRYDKDLVFTLVCMIILCILLVY